MKNRRKKAKELLHAAYRVSNYRRDIIAQEQCTVLRNLVEEVEVLLNKKQVDQAVFDPKLEQLDLFLRKIGGKIYPKTFLSDNIEVILVAAIIVIGIRSFFFQPFIIPTNSMYPTYSGMNSIVYDEETAPGKLSKIISKLALGARHYKVTANNSGEIELLFAQTGNGGQVAYYDVIDGRKWFGIMPARLKEYTFLVDQIPHALRVPLEFDLEDVLTKSLLKKTTPKNIRNIGNGLVAISFGQHVNEGDAILKFSITLGDALFVDRLSYHFRKPKVGDPFVFRTDDILESVGRATGDYTPKYYIKRIGGAEYEKIEIIDGTLHANNKPRTEVEAFVNNSKQIGEYNGYFNERLMAKGRSMRVPNNSYVALGDNSANSADSRYWGFVPDQALIGKAIFIYYPFTKRWGLAN
ncbi:MAG: signal peptidase I [Verrucomicrobiota bacterium]|nr:signal peptidase I [Verrucomicrobiota bacterium]